MQDDPEQSSGCERISARRTLLRGKKGFDLSVAAPKFRRASVGPLVSLAHRFQIVSRLQFVGSNDVIVPQVIESIISHRSSPGSEQTLRANTALIRQSESFRCRSKKLHHLVTKDDYIDQNLRTTLAGVQPNGCPWSCVDNIGIHSDLRGCCARVLFSQVESPDGSESTPIKGGVDLLPVQHERSRI